MAWYNKSWRDRGTSSSSSSSRSYGSWGASSWGGWDSFREKEDNSSLIIKKPEGYLTPTKREIRNKLEFGNRFTGFYSKNQSVSKEEEEFVKDFSHFFYHDMLGEKPEDTFIDKYSEENISSCSEEELAKYHNYKQAFEKVVDIKVPFYTPLEKSIFYLEVLREMAREQNKSMQEMMQNLGQQMENMKIDEDNLNNKDVNEILDRMLGNHQEEEEGDGDIDLDDLFGDGEEGEGEGQEGEGKSKFKDLANNNNAGGRKEESSKKNGGNKGGDSEPEHIFRGILERYGNRNSDGTFQSNIQKSELLKKISRIAEFGEQFAIEKEVVTKAAVNSRQRRTIQMTSLEQVANVDLLQRVLPNFPIKLASQNLRVNIPVKTTENKQKIIVLIDRSGSMSSGEKAKWIMAFLADRLKSVMEEEAEIFISNFEARVSDLHFYHAWDKQSALKLMKEYSWYPSGGDTHIGDMINHISNEINEKGRLHNLNVDLSKEKVEILVINDGQDSVKTDSFPWKTNALTLCDGINHELKDLCLKTGGKYIFIQDSKNIQEFENKQWV